MRIAKGARKAAGPFAPIDDAIAAIRAGRMIIVVDDEDRENEGDLTIAAQFASPDAVNFMARYGRGLICLCLTEARCDELELRPMTPRNETQFGTAFTVAIEAREGVTTGISAHDRSHTIQVAINPAKERARFGAAWPRVSVARTRRRGAAACRPDRGGGRPRAACRAGAGWCRLRDHE